MNRARHIPWFNPREMDDATVLALNTGRAALLSELLGVIEQRSQHPGHFTHWLLTGPRGAGKSFFLRLLQSSINRKPIPQLRFVLLPEELPNVGAPHELLGEIERMLTSGGQEKGAIPMWRVADPGALWDQALQQLLGAFSESLLVVGIENMPEVLAQAFANDVDNSRLRHLMSNEPRIMLVATALQGEFDENHSQRLFRQFEHRTLQRWNEQDHRTYLRLRARQQGGEPSAQQLNRIDAYSRYTGGNPRAAAVLAATILDVDDLLTGADDLDAAIEKMSDYYRALIARIPVNTRKLFDALVRGGEPASQTDLATRTGARPNEISRAFGWLLDNGYVSETREAGSKNKQYRILDRLLVQFYRMRYMHPGQRSRLAVMADLLADMLSYADKWQFASRYAEIDHDAEAQTLVNLALKERQIDINLLPAEMQNVRRLIADQVQWAQHDARYTQRFKGDLQRLEALLAQFADDAALKTAIDHAAILARASTCGAMQGKELVELLAGSLSMSPIDKYGALIWMISVDRNEGKWQELEKVFKDELDLFKKLEATESEVIARLQDLNSIGQASPLTVSLHNLAIDLINVQRLVCPAFTAANWAIRAAIAWQQIGNSTYLNEALDYFFVAVDKSIHNEWAPQALLQALNLLEPLKPVLKLHQQLVEFETTGVLLTELNQAQSALQCHQEARQICLQQNDASLPKAKQRATWNLAKMAWNCGVLGDVNKAIALHQTAVTERISQEDTESAGWNLGQIARHRVAQTEDVQSAWHELDTALLTLETNGVTAIRQLGDAVADACSSKNPSHGFAIGVDILHGLAQRPRYPAEVVLRGLWIDMIEMNVPFALLQDLLGEWPRLWPNHLPDSEHDGILVLQKVLQEFLAELLLTPEARADKRKQDDPDLSTTLAALEQALPPKTRHRLGLLTGIRTIVN